MTKPMKRGLNALLANIEDLYDDVKTEDKIYSVSVDKIIPNPSQPRKSFKEESLIELAESIREHGIIQPLVVKKQDDNYVIIAGERRYRAAKMINLYEVPVIVREYDEAKTKEISLIENLQREDLNAIEESEAIHELMVCYGFTQEEVAQRLGKARPSIANSLRLLNLTSEVKEYVKTEKLSAGHARALLGIPNPTHQIEIAKKVILEGWSVRETEKQVKLYINQPRNEKTNTLKQEKISIEMRNFIDDMTRVFATRVKLVGNESKGKIAIEYYSNDDLQRIYEVIESLKYNRY